MTSGQDYLDQLSAMQGTYPALAADMIARGWQVVWATVNQDGDWTPLKDTTGGKAAFPQNRPMPPGSLSRIAFRPPPGVVIIDVDHYDYKLGWHTIERAEEKLGTLPATWKVSARGAHDNSGRYLFRSAVDFKDSALAAFADPETGATCVEVVRTGHRFSWAPGDYNPKTGTQVLCYGPGGQASMLPRPEELPELPPEWQAYLNDPPRAGTPQLPPVDTDVPKWWLLLPNNSMAHRDQLRDLAFEMLVCHCPPEEIQAELMRISSAEDLSRPWTPASLAGLTDANSQGKVAEIHVRWAEDRARLPASEAWLELAPRLARHEWEVAQEIASSPNRALVVSQGLVQGAGDISEEDFATGRFTVDTVLKTVIAGDHQFEADGTDDQSLAEAVLDRMQGARYCADSGQWVVWGQSKWAEVPGDLLSWVIAHLAKNMPVGTAKPDEDDPNAALLKRQFRNWAYLRSSSGSSAVASKARALLMLPGQHELSISRADLDANPYVVWGGGRCWDIRASIHAIVEDRESLGEAHLKTAECAPQEMPIPGFWSLVSAILPDPASREFWLDMMARGLVGVQSKRTVPLAVGETGMGKTLLLERLPYGNYIAPVSGQDLLGGGDREEARRFHVLVGCRMPVIDEGISDSRYTLGRLKKLTSGGSRLPARGIFGREYEFKPVHTLVFLVNPEEEPKYTDDAVMSRICRVHFNGDAAQVKYVASYYEPGSEMWEQETPGVLAFFIRRAAEILATGSDRGTSFAKPESVKMGQESVAGEQDVVLDWLMQRTVPAQSESEYTLAGTLYENFLEFASRRQESRPSNIAFGRRLTKHGVPVKRPGGQNMRGVRFKQVAFMS